LAKTDTISSTEKLLDLIRGKQPSEGPPPEAAQPVAAGLSDLSTRFGKMLKIRRPATIGVSLGYTDVKLVKVYQTSGNTQELVDYRLVSYPPDLNPQHPDFPSFLKRTLYEFTRGTKFPEIWSSISSARVELRYLKIPKVPKRQIANTVFWTFKKEVNFSETDTVFDFDFLGETLEDGVPKFEVLAYTAPRQEVDEIKQVFARSGFTLTGISIVPFLLQNLLRNQWIPVESENVCSLYIGRDWSRIDIFSNHNLVLSRGIKAGMNSMIEAIRQQMSEETNVEMEGAGEEVSEPEMKELDRQELEGLEEARRIFFGFIHHPAFEDLDPGQTFSDNDIYQMILPALQRLIRQVDRTLRHFSLKFDSVGVDKVFISGPINGQMLLVNTISQFLGIDLDVFDPMGAASALDDGISPPPSVTERESYLPAVGLALSRNDRTPNFLHTYKEKGKAETARRISSVIYIGLLLASALCLAVFIWQTTIIDQKTTELEGLNRELDSTSPRVTEAMIRELLKQVRSRQAKLKRVGKRYQGMAVINEITRLTPADIRLLKLDIRLGVVEKSDEPPKLIMEGVVFGDRRTPESALAEYLVKLEKSPLFSSFSIKRRSFVEIEDKNALRFTAHLRII